MTVWLGNNRNVWRGFCNILFKTLTNMKADHVQQSTLTSRALSRFKTGDANPWSSELQLLRSCDFQKWKQVIKSRSCCLLWWLSVNRKYLQISGEKAWRCMLCTCLASSGKALQCNLRERSRLGLLWQKWWKTLQMRWQAIIYGNYNSQVNKICWAKKNYKL